MLSLQNGIDNSMELHGFLRVVSLLQGRHFKLKNAESRVHFTYVGQRMYCCVPLVVQRENATDFDDEKAGPFDHGTYTPSCLPKLGKTKFFN